MDAKLIDLTSKRYCKYSLWLVVAMTLCGFVAMSVNWIEISLLNALAVSAIYSIVINLLYGFFWKKVAKSASGITKIWKLGDAERKFHRELFDKLRRESMPRK